MKRDFTKLMAAFALLAFLIPVAGWGQMNASYTITAKTGSGDGSQISTSTNVSDVFTETTYPNTFTTATKAYYNGSSGIKLGTSSDSGTLTFSLKQAGQVNAQTITVRAKRYNSNAAATINVNDGTAQSLTSDFVDYTFTINQNITSIALASSKYCWISSITVSYTESTTPTPSGDLIIDFENAASAYTDWTFTNLTSKQTSSITAHGGTYYGTNTNSNGNGVATASIKTTQKIATPQTLTCYVSKQSTNTAASTWYIQVSSDGSAWTDVASRSASDMSKGEWKEFTADLSSYTNVYVRVYYSGSTAIRNIDDLTLITTTAAVAAPTFSPAGGTYAQAQNVSISCATSGATIYYTTDGSIPSNTSTLYNGPITVSESMTIKAVAYDGNNNVSAIASASYTIQLPLVTMDEIFSAAQNAGSTATSVNITFGNWVVSGVSTNGKNVFVTDGTKGFVIYDTNGNMGFAVGNVLSGTASCKVQLYNGFAELTQLNSTTSGLSVTTGGNVTEANIAMANLAGVNTGALVHYDGLTCSVTTNNNNNTFYYLADGTTTIQVYNSLYAFEALVDGKSYNITGVYQQYNSTKEVLPRSAADIVEVLTPVINASNVTLAYNATSGEIGYTITNPVAGTALAATTSADWISGITVGAESVTFTTTVNNTTEDRTATVTLTYGSVTKTVTVTQEHFVADYATLPFAFDGGRADVATTVGLTQSGLGTDYTPSAANDYSPRLKFDSTDDWLLLKFNERPGELSYDIMGNSFNGSTFKVQTSVDGVTYTDFATYTNLVSKKQHITHNNLAEDVRYIKWIYTNKVNGNVALGNIELDVYQAPQEYDLTIGTPPNIFILAQYGNNQSVVNGYTAAVLSSTVVTLLLTPSSGYVLDLVTAYDAQNNPISLTEVSDNVYNFIMPSSDVTVSADVIAAHQEYYYTRATSLEPGRRYIIVAERNGKYLAMGAQKNNNRNAKPISVDGTTATVIRSDVHEFTIGSIDDNSGHYFIFDVDEEGESSGYLYAGSSSSNQLKTETELDANGHWAITVNPETGEGTIIGQGSYTRNVMRFNQDNELFSCYAAGNSGDQYPVYLYMKDDGFDLTITGYTDVTVGTNNKGYYLIASPVTVNPADVAGMTEGTFDLYYYDDSQTLEWINWKGDQNPTLDHGGFDLVPGTGYLYAKKATTPGETYTFTLSGEVYSGNGEIPLVDGWNLIGNPYNSQVEPITDYYEMNEEGSEIIAGESWVIAPMQGIFINNDYDASSTSFNILSKGAKKAGLVLNLSRAASKGSTAAVIDRAVVRFGEGRQLPKFQLFENSTKLYIPQGDKDYAVVYANNDMDELPVSFKAEQSGTYTLSMNVEGVSLGYLHLIDNLTGMDIDLLATPSYTFEAKTSDYASRFKVVFVANGPSTGSDTFAFYSNGNWVINNEGGATMQLVDVNGRVLKSESINGCASVRFNATPGIYMLRLVNGDDVKVQKIVVR